MISKYSRLEITLIYLGLLLFLGFLLLPILEALLVSLRPMTEVFNVPHRFITPNMGFEAYVTMWESQPYLLRNIFNSLIISFGGTFLAMVCIIPAAYAFARFSFGGRDAMLSVFLSINMIGAAVLIIPLYKIMITIGLINTYWAMIIPGAVFTIPTGIFLMRTYFLRVPKELGEAAYVDGASALYTLRRVILPVAAPGIAVVAITVFIIIYAQQFLFALTFNSVSEYAPLSVGIFGYFGRQTVIWNELMAAALTGVLPVLVVYMFLQRHIVAGLTAGAVKS